MKHLKLAIEIDWASGSEIPSEHYDALHEKAAERANDLIEEGYIEGELHTHVRALDSDPEDGVEYRGYWRLVHETRLHPILPRSNGSRWVIPVGSAIGSWF